MIGLTAAKIVKGNTILGISGTSTAAPTKLNGTFTLYVSTAKTKGSKTVTFSTPFSTTPTINLSASSDRPTQISAENGSYSITSKSKAGFTVTTDGDNPGYGTLTFTWNAVV